jgi:hypothetical protein
LWRETCGAQASCLATSRDKCRIRPAGALLLVWNLAANAAAKIVFRIWKGGQKVKRLIFLIFLAIPAGVLAVVLSLTGTNWIAQPTAAAQTQTSQKGPEAPPPGMGPMGGHMGRGMPCGGCGGCEGMMGGPRMLMHGPMMGHPMMGMEMMGGEWAVSHPKLAAKMMEMRAEMMKAQAGILEKYAKELETGKFSSSK